MRRGVLAVALLVALASACGDSNKVGSDALVNFQDEAQQRLGERTPTPQPTRAPTSGGSERTAAPKGAIAQPTRPPSETAAITIAINSDTGDTKGSFDPTLARVYAGAIVAWKNNDSVPRAIVADNKSFDSGPIAPGATWTRRFTSAGKVNYHDGTRPYAVGIVEVLPK